MPTDLSRVRLNHINSLITEAVKARAGRCVALILSWPGPRKAIHTVPFSEFRVEAFDSHFEHGVVLASMMPWEGRTVEALYPIQKKGKR